MKKVSSFLVLFFLVAVVQLKGQDKKSGYGVKSDSTESDYKNTDQLGGPKTIGAQLKADNQKKESYFRIPIKVTKGWYDWKKQLAAKTGIELGINYSSLHMRASDVFDEEANDKRTGGGVFDFQMTWNAVNRKLGKNKGTFGLKINSRFGYGDLTAPMFHGFNDSGYYGLPGTGFNDYSMRIVEFYYSQMFLNNKVGVIVGKIDPSNYYNFHGMAIPWTAFMNYGSLMSSTVNFHNPGFGIGIGAELSKHIYLKASVMDVYGDKFEQGDFLDFGPHFFNGDMQLMAEIGWTPTIAERYFKNFSLTYWSAPSYTSHQGGEIKAGSGIAFSSHWFFNDNYMPFFRFGIGNGNGENLFSKKDIQIGNGFLLRSHDLIGLSFSVAETNNPLGLDDPKNQMTAELFYRFQLTPHLAVTPDIQMIANPALNPNVDVLWYSGFRIRATF
jgi:porin